MAPTILIVGATGNTGRGVVQTLPNLLKQSRTLSQHRVLALTRSLDSPIAKELSNLPNLEFAEQNWIEITSDWLREREVVRVFIASHNEPTQFAEEGQFHVEALNAGVKYVVRISTTAANVVPDSRAYYPRTHWAIEHMLSQPEFQNLHWTSLQPNVFYPFVLGPVAEFIREFRKTGKQGKLSFILDANTPTAMVDPVDVGVLAANLLVLDDPSAYDQARLVVNGPEDVTSEQIVAWVEEIIGAKVENVSFKDVSAVHQWADATTTGSKNLIRSITYAPVTSWEGKAQASTTSQEVLALAAPESRAKEYLAKMLA